MYKTRFVACGSEEFREDELSFPVESYTIVKLVLFLVLQQKWHIRRYNFQNAFLIALLKRAVKACPPKQVSNDTKHKGRVLKVRRKLYGFKYAAKIWFESISAQFRSCGLEETESETVHISEKVYGCSLLCQYSSNFFVIMMRTIRSKSTCRTSLYSKILDS